MAKRPLPKLAVARRERKKREEPLDFRAAPAESTAQMEKHLQEEIDPHAQRLLGRRLFDRFDRSRKRAGKTERRKAT